MNKIYLTESEVLSLVKKNVEQKRLLDKWENLNEEEKEAVVKFSNILSKRKDLVKESWYNTVGDIVGIFDPTGVVDLVNGISYFAKGDKLYGTLSMVSAIPYLGDLIAKPILLGGKATKAGLSGLKAAMNTGRAADIAAAANKAGGKTAEFVKTADKWSPQVMSILNKGKRIPLVGRFFKRIEEWMKIMTQASKNMKLAKASTKGVLPRSAFRNYGIDTSKNVFSRLWQRGGFLKNRKLSTLLFKSKTWLGFLDWVGVSNFVGPEEFEKEYGEQYTEDAMSSYLTTPEGNEQFQSEFAQGANDNERATNDNESSVGTDDIVSLVFGGLL
jgi:hypothetical protein